MPVDSGAPGKKPGKHVREGEVGEETNSRASPATRMVTRGNTS